MYVSWGMDVISLVAGLQSSLAQRRAERIAMGPPPPTAREIEDAEAAKWATDTRQQMRARLRTLQSPAK